MPKRAKIGDVIEIPTAKGLAYAQYTHQHAREGGLLRVFKELHAQRPQNFAEIVKGPMRFSVLFPVRVAVWRDIFKVAAREEIAEHNKPFPIFRVTNDLPKERASLWWFWDGEKEWRVGAITEEQRHMPLREIPNDTLLIERIESNWTPANDRR